MPKAATRWGLALMLGLLGAFARAAEPADTEFTLEIAAQPLEYALSAFADQSGIQLVFYTDLAAGLKVQRLSGKFTARQALEQLLASTGLRYEFINERTVRIDSVARPASETTPQLPPREAPPAGLRSTAISGRIEAARSESALAGALIRIQEAPVETKSDELGNFRLPPLPPGHYTLEISYLGFAPLQAAIHVSGQGGAVWNVYRLEEPARGLDEVIVFGGRSSRAIALNLQRSADNSSSVVSADMLGNFTDQTISEALRRVPGVAFRRGPLGDGTNVEIRGLSPDMNNVQLNGLNLPNAGFGRAPALNTLLADSIEKITVNETLLPSHDSAGTGGLIQIETRSPLNRPHRYANVSLEAGRKGEDRGDDQTVSGTLSGTFGAERNFGASLSAQYLKRSGKVFYYDSTFNLGAYLPLDPSGAPTLNGRGYFDPRMSFPLEPGVDEVYPDSSTAEFSDVRLTNRTVTLSAEWQPSSTTRLQLDVQRASQIEDRYASTNYFGFGSPYEPLPVAALDGEVRQALAWDGYAFVTQDLFLSQDAKSTTDSLSLRGNAALGRFEHSFTLGYTQGSLEQPSSMQMSFAVPSEEPLDPSMISPAAVDPLEGRILSPFAPRSGRGVPLPLLTPAGWASLFDGPTSALLQNVAASSGDTDNERYTGALSSRLGLDGRYLKYIELGANLERVRFRGRRQLSLYDGTEFIDDPPYVIQPSAADLGIGYASASGTLSGIPEGTLQIMPRSELLAFVQRLPSLAAGPDPVLTRYDVPRDPRLNSAYLQENNLASYLQARMELGKLEIVGGVRQSHVRTRSVNLTSPIVIDRNGVNDVAFAERFTQLESLEDSGSDLLPRFQFNYRQTQNLIFRAAYYQTVARPRAEQLSAESSIVLNLGPFASGGPNRDQPTLDISKGNPSLKPAVGHNFDLDAEYYAGSIGLLKVSVFYKRIRNLLDTNIARGSSLLDGVTLPDDPYFQTLPEDLVVSVIQPVNSPDLGEVHGASFAIERQLTFLPSFWRGLGFYANYTFASDRTPNHFTWFSQPIFDTDGNLSGAEAVDLDVGRNDRRSHSGTASLTYSRGQLDGSLSYSQQQSREAGFQSYSLLPMPYRASSLDLRVQYQFPIHGGLYRTYFEATNLLRGTDSMEEVSGLLMGSADTVSNATYYGGRTFRLGVAATF